MNCRVQVEELISERTEDGKDEQSYSRVWTRRGVEGSLDHLKRGSE